MDDLAVYFIFPPASATVVRYARADLWRRLFVFGKLAQAGASRQPQPYARKKVFPNVRLKK